MRVCVCMRIFLMRKSDTVQIVYFLKTKIWICGSNVFVVVFFFLFFFAIFTPTRKITTNFLRLCRYEWHFSFVNGGKSVYVRSFGKAAPCFFWYLWFCFVVGLVVFSRVGLYFMAQCRHYHRYILVVPFSQCRKICTDIYTPRKEIQRIRRTRMRSSHHKHNGDIISDVKTLCLFCLFSIWFFVGWSYLTLLILSKRIKYNNEYVSCFITLLPFIVWIIFVVRDGKRQRR